MLIAFDIDGTLADLTHRLHWVTNLPDGGKPDWEAFFALVHKDKPIPEMCLLAETLMAGIQPGIPHDVIFVSGRNSVCREATIRWLADNLNWSEDGIDAALYMRSKGDRRPDNLVKYDLLQQVVADWGKVPDIVFDDRQQVVDMWRKNGVRCCQVAKGDF